MRDFVRQFLAAAATTLDLDGPVALIATGRKSGEAGNWMRRQFAHQLALDCRVPSAGSIDAEIDLASLPVESESLRTLLCLDLLRRFEETAELLKLSLPLLAPGGMVLVTADIGSARPQAGSSRVLTPLGLERLVADMDAAILGWQGDVDFPNSLFLVACRSPVTPRFAHRAGRFIEAFQGTQPASAGPFRWPVRLWRSLKEWRPRRVDQAATSTSFLLHLPRAADWKEALLNWPPGREVPGAGLDLC